MAEEHNLDALAAFVEERLDEGERDRLMAHVADCAECRATLAAMSRARAAGALVDAPRTGLPSARRGMRVGLGLAASVVLASFAWMYLAPPHEPANGDGVDVRRGVERIVNGKTFRLEEGVWIDRASDDARGLRTVRVQGAEQRARLLAQMPELIDYADLGSRVVVVADGNIYRFEP
jgi:hypothetical protein